MRVSVVVPSKGCVYLNYLLYSLKNQIIKPYEIIIITKNCNYIKVEKLCKKLHAM